MSVARLSDDLLQDRERAVAKASLNRAMESLGIDAKRDDLPLARLKVA